MIFRTFVSRSTSQKIKVRSNIQKKINFHSNYRRTNKKDDFYSSLKVYESLSIDDRIKYIFVLGGLYSADGPQHDYEKALKCFLKTAELGDLNSLCILGEFYYLGKGTEKDEKKALEYFTRGAELGHTRSKYQMGLVLARRDGVDKEKERKVVEDFIKASEMGDKDASYFLGCLYRNEGSGDNEIALTFFLRAMELGHEEAKKEAIAVLFNLGKKSIDNNEVQAAIRYYQQAYELGDHDAGKNIGVIYLYRDQVDKAMEWYNSCLEKGDKSVYYHMATIYVSTSAFPLAYKYLMLSFENGFEKANSALGIGLLYLKGDGIGQDFTKAIEWLKISTLEGGSEAPSSIGDIYLWEETYVDPLEAIKWYEISAERGNYPAYYTLAALSIEHLKDFDSAIKYAKKGSENGNLDSQAILGYAYWMIGNRIEGNTHLQNAKDSGSDIAESLLQQLKRTL